jgi:hypothetical protein
VRFNQICVSPFSFKDNIVAMSETASFITCGPQLNPPLCEHSIVTKVRKSSESVFEHTLLCVHMFGIARARKMTSTSILFATAQSHSP